MSLFNNGQNLFSNLHFLMTKLSRKLLVFLLFLMLAQLFLGFLEILSVASVVPLFEVLSGEEVTNSESWILVRDLLTLITGQNDPQILAIIFFVVSTGSASILKLLFFFLREKLFLRMCMELSKSLFQSVFFVKPTIFLQRNSDQITANFANDLNSAVGSLQGIFTLLSSAVISGCIIVFTIMESFDVAKIVFPLILVYYLIVSRSFIPRVIDNGSASTQAFTDKTGAVHNAISNYVGAFLYGSWAKFERLYLYAELRYRKARASSTLIRELPRPLLELILISSFSYILLSTILTNGNITDISTKMVAFVFAAYRLLPYVQVIYNSSAGVVSEKLAIERLSELLKVENSKSDLFGPASNFNFHNLEVSNFGLARNEQLNSKLVKKLNLSFLKGDRIFITGKSGSGKSTLLLSLMGVIEQQYRNIKVNDQTLDVIGEAWREQIAFCSGKTSWINGTIRENLSLHSLETISDEEIWSALKTVELDVEVSELKDQLNAKMNTISDGVSLGQAQRLAIARTLLHKRPILILDEGTNSIEAEKEQRIVERLSKLENLDLIILVSHNQSLKRYFDKIITI